MENGVVAKPMTVALAKLSHFYNAQRQEFLRGFPLAVRIEGRAL
jgi:hypothetical protein